MRQPLGIAHTYYVPYLGRVFGAASVELAGLLHDVWIEQSSVLDPELTDGVSAWLDPAGRPHLAVVAAREVRFEMDPARLAHVQRTLLAAPAEVGTPSTEEILAQRAA